jgi:hypothetical protein
MKHSTCSLAAVSAVLLLLPMRAQDLPSVALPFEVAGVTVTPHNRALRTRFLADTKNADGARVQLFIRNPSVDQTLSANDAYFDDVYPLRHVMDGAWSWHDTPGRWDEEHKALPPGALTVWSFNGVRKPWAPGGSFRLRVEDWGRGPGERTVELPTPEVWLSAVTFLGEEIQPDHLVIHVANASKSSVKLTRVGIYLPKDLARYHVFYAQPELRDLKPFPSDGIIAAGEKGGAVLTTGKLPLTYAVVEVLVSRTDGSPLSLWAKLRIKRETFDISGGWVDEGGATGATSAVTHEPFLKLLKREHINTAHLGLVPGYADQTGPEGLYTRYPLRFFGNLLPLEVYDTDRMLPRVHGVDALGEPQFGGGSGQRLPQEVIAALEKYAPTRLTTTLTLSDESNWRYYAGLSDFPHLDAYRVTAPSADAWTLYDRWNGMRIGWGSPLETIGDMCRSLRELSRPAPTAYWSQTAHRGWEVYDGRQRLSPTVDEIRLQAYHALSSRITSFYWFNPSLASQVQYRDTIAEMERIGREIRMLEAFYLQGDAYRYLEVKKGDKPDWDLASIVAPPGALLFALDLDYRPDPKEKIFVFGSPREARFSFDLPSYLRKPADLFRVDADGIHEVRWSATAQGVLIDDTLSRVGIYVAAATMDFRSRLEKRRRELIAIEESTGFDPARSDADFAILRGLAP